MAGGALERYGSGVFRNLLGGRIGALRIDFQTLKVNTYINII